MVATGLGIEAEVGAEEEDDVRSRRRLVGVEYEGENLAVGLLLGSLVVLLGCGEG